jgi:uncharacterized protein
MTGVGGGSLMTPLLIRVFGVHPTTAVGTDLVYAASTNTVGTFVHATARTVDWAIVGLLAMGSAPATIGTILILSQFDLQGTSAQRLISLTLGAVLLVTAAFLMLGRKVRERATPIGCSRSVAAKFVCSRSCWAWSWASLLRRPRSEPEPSA